MFAPPPSRPTAGNGRSLAWLVALILGTVGIVAYALMPNELVQDLIYQLFGLAAALSLVVGVRLHRPRRALPWYLMAVGLACWSVADAVGNYEVDVLGVDQFPSAADPIYLVTYPVVAAGLVGLIRSRKLGADPAGVLDSAIVTVALGVLSWVLLARPTMEAFAGSAPAAVIGLAYPVTDIILTAILIRMVATPGGRTPSFWLLLFALASLIAADTAASGFNMLSFDANGWVDWLWLASYALWAAAALHPSMTDLTEPDATQQTFGRGRLVALTVAVLVAPVTLAVQHLLGLRLDVWAVVVGSVLIFLLVMARIRLSFSQLSAAYAERQRAQLELTRQATHDALTGLANRTQALDLIRGALARTQRSGGIVGLLFVDLDDFKRVNDTLGHLAGDEVLQEVARRMLAGIRAGDAVARIGGDEFVVLLEPVVDEPAAVGVAQRLIEELAEPILLSSGRQARIGASIGVAVNSDGVIDPDRLIHEADQAAYRAKAGGRGRVEVFAASLRAELARRGAMERAVVEAVGRGEVWIRTCAVLDLASMRTAGTIAEAVLTGPDGRQATRSEVVEVIDGTDAACELDAWVLRYAVTQGRADLVRIVPITGRHLSQPRIVEDVRTALAGGTDPRTVMLLVPALDSLDDVRVLGHLSELRALGVSVCIDGFGAGSGTTDRWASLPFDHVRLDQRLLGAGVGPILLRLTVETAHAFGYRVLAAPITDSGQLAALRHAGCDLGQGLFLAADVPPVPSTVSH